MTTSVLEGIEKLVWIMVCFLPVYSVVRICILRKRKLEKQTEGSTETEMPTDWAREIFLALFLLFMVGLLGLTFENHGVDWMKKGIFARAANRLRTGIGVNFVPFRTIRSFLRHTGRGMIMVNIVGNIVMFLPWGLGLPLLWKNQQKAWKLTAMSFLLPVYIEFLQLFIGRSVDIDDIILNFVGGMLGGLLYFLLAWLFPGIKKLAR